MEDNQVKAYIEGTQELLTKTAAVYQQHAPILADKLIALGLVKASSKQATIQSLQSPELVLSTFNLLLDSSLASQTKQASASKLGEPVMKTAAVKGQSKKESDIVFDKYFN